MTPIDYFKLQAKNLFRDYKTQTSYVDEIAGNTYYKYEPKYFDIERIFIEYDWNEVDFTLMKAQHLISLMLGFGKWTELLKASKPELELAKLLFDNQHKISVEDWGIYIEEAENDNKTIFDTESRVEIFKQVFGNVEGHHNPFGDYRLHKTATSA